MPFVLISLVFHPTTQFICLNVKKHSAPTGNKTVRSQTLKTPEMSYDESKSVCKHIQLQCWTKFIERGRSIHWHYSSQDIQAHWNYCMLRVSGVTQRHGRWIRHTEPVLWERREQTNALTLSAVKRQINSQNFQENPQHTMPSKTENPRDLRQGNPWEYK